MKHATLLYSCMGLMGAAAIAGFVDFSHASRSGKLKDLYHDKINGTGITLISTKTVDFDDYSRGPIEEYQPPKEMKEELVFNTSHSKKKTKPEKKIISEVVAEANIEATPHAEIKIETVEVTPVVETLAEVPKVEEMKVEPVLEDTLIVEEKKELSFRSFSRAPLKYSAKKKSRKN
jgi:hypothetical protein